MSSPLRKPGRTQQIQDKKDLQSQVQVLNNKIEALKAVLMSTMRQVNEMQGLTFKAGVTSEYLLNALVQKAEITTDANKEYFEKVTEAIKAEMERQKAEAQKQVEENAKRAEPDGQSEEAKAKRADLNAQLTGATTDITVVK